MDIVYMTPPIRLITNYMIPKSMLPDPATSQIEAFVIKRPETHLSSLKNVRDVERSDIDHQVEVLRQDDPGLEVEWSMASHRTNCTPKQVYIFEQHRLPFVRYIGNKVHGAGVVYSSQL